MLATSKLAAQVAVLLLVSGCGLGFGPGFRSQPPPRSSPALVPLGTSSYGPNIVLDSRRDGLYATPTKAGLEIRRLEGSASKALFAAPGDDAGALLVSRSDDAVAVATWDRLHLFDGSALTDLTPRLNAAFVLARPTSLIRIVGLDLTEDGTVAATVAVGGQFDDAPYGQLCFLRPAGRDTCEGIDSLSADGLAGDASVLAQGGQTFLLVEARLHVRVATGVFRLVADGVGQLRALDDGRVGYIVSSGTSSALVVVGGDRREERRVEGTWGVVGHSADGLWEVTVDAESDGSCSGLEWRCHESLVWSQLIVWRVGATRTEVAHLDAFPGDEVFRRILIPGADGSLVLQVEGNVYAVAAP